MEPLNHTVDLCLIREAATQFSTGVGSVYISANKYKGSFSSTSPPTLISRLFGMGHSHRHEMYLLVVWICIPLTRANDFLFVCLLAICRSSVEKCLFRFSAHVLIGFFISFVLSCMSS